MVSWDNKPNEFAAIQNDLGNVLGVKTLNAVMGEITSELSSNPDVQHHVITYYTPNGESIFE